MTKSEDVESGKLRDKIQKSSATSDEADSNRQFVRLSRIASYDVDLLLMSYATHAVYTVNHTRKSSENMKYILNLWLFRESIPISHFCIKYNII